MKKRGFLVLLQVLSSVVFSQEPVRIATYNLLNYPGIDGGQRDSYFRIVVHTMDPDVLIVQEMESQSGMNQFLGEVMNVSPPGEYSSVPFHDGTDTDNGCFYKPSRVTFLGASYIGTALRDIAEYRFMPAGSDDTLRVFSVHLNAGEADSIPRLGEATILRNYLNGMPDGAMFVVGGDFNIYRSSEPAFQELVGPSGGDNGRCTDPLNAVGTWNNNPQFRFIHTQSTRTRSFGGGTTGGLDDRFDMILRSSSLDTLFLASSYTAYGNDGAHFNDSINKPPNSAVPDSVADALELASDHLPVFAGITSPGGQVPCDSLDLFQARCQQGGSIQARVVLLNSTKYAGKQVVITIDGTDYPATIMTNGVNSRATVQAIVGGGDHTVVLSDPAGCFEPLLVQCGPSEPAGEDRLPGR